MKFPSIPPRTIILCIALGAVISYRYFPAKKEVHAFRVRPYCANDVEWAKSHLFHDLLFQAQQIQRGDFSDLPDNGMGKIYCEDPRDIISFLWFDFNQYDREFALKTLGFPADISLEQFVNGPQPKWFSTPGIYWHEAALFWCGC